MKEHQEFQQGQEKPEKEAKEFRLPKIERLPSREYPKEIKSNTRLPTLRSETQIEGSQGGTERRSIEEEDFVGHVEKKLRLIMEEQNIIEIAQSEESDGEDFQKKIIQNKEIIKEAKRRHQKLRGQQYNNKDLMKKFSQKMKLEGYQKKFRQFKQASLQNKNIARKKQMLNNIVNKNPLRDIKQSQKQIPKSSIILKQINNSSNREFKEIRSKDELTSFHKVLPNQLSAKKQPLPSTQQRKVKKQFSQKHLTPLQKNQQLFDAIHNYIENPKRPEAEIIPQKIVKQRMQIQQKLKQYEVKLSNPFDNQPRQRQNQKQQIEVQKFNGKMVSSTHWRKIGVIDSDLKNETSSFEKQVDRIGNYLQRNEKSLEKYIQNQKMLIDVKIAKRQSSKERYKSCQKQNSI